jgi:putative toxin-antitoxin system antitoxin component (TIGR02293 family)
MLTLKTLLLLNDDNTANLALHDTVSAGLDPQVIKVLSSHLGVTPKQLQDLAAGGAPLARKDRLPRDVSNFLFRVASALAHLEKAMEGDVAKAAQWLRNANPSLKNHIPILLLQSYMGTELVKVAIARLKPELARREGGYELEEEPESEASKD